MGKKKVNAMIGLLKQKGIVLGFEDPVHDGGNHLLGILSDFMDYAFFQEQGRMGPGSKGFIDLIPKDAGCTLDPHATSHRKAAKLIRRFIEAGKTLKNKLKHPSSIKKFGMCGFSFCGMYPNIAKGLGLLTLRVTEAFNMFRLNANDESKTKKDLVDKRGLRDEIVRRFGSGWPKKGLFVGDKWPKCTCRRDSDEDECGTCRAEFKDKAALTAAGWSVTGFDGIDNLRGYNHLVHHSHACNGHHFHAYKNGNGVGVASKTFAGSGEAKLVFGNCWDAGKTNVYLNGEEIGSAKPHKTSQIVKFAFESGDKLAVKDEEGNAVVQLVRLVTPCDSPSHRHTPHKHTPHSHTPHTHHKHHRHHKHHPHRHHKHHRHHRHHPHRHDTSRRRRRWWGR